MLLHIELLADGYYCNALVYPVIKVKPAQGFQRKKQQKMGKCTQGIPANTTFLQSFGL
jgi:hypothetical protein